MRDAVIKVLGLALVLVISAGCGSDRDADDVNGVTGDTAGTVPMQGIPDEPAVSTTVSKINLNTASEEEFMTIPDVGERMVHEFEEYRPYVSIRQFRREIGKYVDEEQVAAYEEYVYVPIDPNESDAETLMQIPGLDESEAASLIEARPYTANEAFLQALSGYVSESELATATSYLSGP